jgi:hypothetical protein
MIPQPPPRFRGRWLELWDGDGCPISRLEPEIVGPDIAGMPFVGVIKHGIMDDGSWASPDRVRRFGAFGLKVAVALGTAGPKYATEIVRLLTARLDACKRADYPLAFSVMDFEGAYDNGATAAANQIADGVLAAHADAADYGIDQPWWDCLYYPTPNDGTHPHFPYKPFGRIVCARYVQAYGAPALGRSGKFLAWARDPSQYASLGAWPVLSTTQCYDRSVADVVAMTLTEPDSLHWHWGPMSASVRLAFRCVGALERGGYFGGSAVKAFQQAAGLKADGILGPATAGALKVPVPASGITWYGNG